ncbi:hypothetical protein ACXZ9C_10795 [Streptococcus agalactiae]
MRRVVVGVACVASSSAWRGVASRGVASSRRRRVAWRGVVVAWRGGVASSRVVVVASSA